MKRPAAFQAMRQARVPACQCGYIFGQSARLMRCVIALYGPGQKVNLFIPANVDGEVHKPALYLGPFVTPLTRQTMGVLLKCLVQNTDKDQPPLAA